MSNDIGSKVRQLRTNSKMTLRDLSEKTNLSIGFLSQLERGLTSIATDSLEKLAVALEVDATYFFMKRTAKKNDVVRGYEKEILKIDNSTNINYLLTNKTEGMSIVPRMIEMLPTNSEEDVTQYNHEGEEFIYVLEGILTLHLEDKQVELYPGDSAHYKSSRIHNYANYTNKTVKLIMINSKGEA